MFNTERTLWVLLLIALVILDACAPGKGPGGSSQAENRTETEYKTVLLTNGQVLIGKLENWGTPFPVLTDVYYVQTTVDPASKKSSSVLVKRGKEWHAPNRTILNANHILLIEPVTKGSKVIEFIEKLNAEQVP